jgi:hypothetical protein
MADSARGGPFSCGKKIPDPVSAMVCSSPSLPHPLFVLPRPPFMWKILGAKKVTFLLIALFIPQNDGSVNNMAGALYHVPCPSSFYLMILTLLPNTSGDIPCAVF